MENKKKLLNHFKAFKQAFSNKDVKIYLDIDNFHILVKGKDKEQIFYPQFVTALGKQKVYTPTFNNDVKRFIGWRPYKPRGIETLSKKIQMKEMMTQFGIPTPAYTQQQNDFKKNVIIKANFSQFGEGIKGPYKSNRNEKLEPSEFYEELIFGDIIKIWFCGDKPICMEQQPMPYIIGNGKNSLQELIELRALIRNKTPNQTRIKNVLDLFDKNFQTVLRKGEKQIIDFCYGSPVQLRNVMKEFTFPLQEAEIDDKIEKIGKLLSNVIVNEKIDKLIYTVDCIWDQNEFWFLEANANPFIHPLVYNTIANTIFS